jgi:hypothetical protein
MHVPVLAVRTGARRRGLARQMKMEVLCIAAEDGVQAVVSKVHWTIVPCSLSTVSWVPPSNGYLETTTTVVGSFRPPSGGNVERRTA